MSEPATLVALLHGPDQPGLVAKTSGWIYARGGNILHADQHRDMEAGEFFQRIEWVPAGNDPGAAVAEFREFAASLGINVDSTADAELTQAIGNQLALTLRNPASGGGMPGSLSDPDREFLTASSPGLDHTPQGNANLIAYNKLVAQRQIDIGNLAKQYVEKNGVLDAGFNDVVNQYSYAHPLFAPAKPQTQADYDALPSGAVFIQPDTGATMRKP